MNRNEVKLSKAKKLTILKVIVIVIPIATGIFAQHIDNKRYKAHTDQIETTDKSENILSNSITIAKIK